MKENVKQVYSIVHSIVKATSSSLLRRLFHFRQVPMRGELLLLCLTLGISACGSEVAAPQQRFTDADAPKNEEDIFYLETQSLTLLEGQVFRLTIQGIEDTSQVSWSSAKEQVVTVRDGVLHAEHIGTSTIEARMGAHRDQMSVVVIPRQDGANKSIQGVLWQDDNGNSRIDDGEKLLRNSAVFLDKNQNGHFDHGEPSSITDARGHYSFFYLVEGSYAVVTHFPSGYKYVDAAPEVIIPAQRPPMEAQLVSAVPDWRQNIVDVGQGFDGVVYITIHKNNGRLHNCSGALLYGGYHVLGAAHCFENARTIFVHFANSTGNRLVKRLYPHPKWTGDDSYDLAILELADIAPYSAERYDIYHDKDEVLQPFVRVGYGKVGYGVTGESTSSTKTKGYNRYDDSNRHFMAAMANYLAPRDSQLSYDFDDGQKSHDAFGYYFSVNDTGLGSLEANAAGGDSGSPSFVAGKIAGISSLSIAFQKQVTDIDTIPLNSSFGEFALDTRVSYFHSWIQTVLQSSSKNPQASYLLETGVDSVHVVNFPFLALK